MAEGSQKKYDDVNAQHILWFFQDKLKRLENPDKHKDGTLDYVPVMNDYAEFANIPITVIDEWATTYPEFKEAYDRCLKIIETILVKMTLAGKCNASFATLTAKNMLGWVDKTETKETKNITVNIAGEFDEPGPPPEAMARKNRTKAKGDLRSLGDD